MITSKYDWQLASPSADEAFLALAKKAGLEASVATLLYERCLLYTSPNEETSTLIHRS